MGLTRAENTYPILRATLESRAFQTHDVLQAMREDAGVALPGLKVDGGACANNFLMQFQADIIGAPVQRPVCIETTALGAAYLAGLAVGYWADQAEVVSNWAVSRTFEPQIDSQSRERLLRGWKKAVGRTLHWVSAEAPQGD